MQVILDTDFLSAFLKIERLELIREFFGEALSLFRRKLQRRSPEPGF